tara:strand:+ start:542 stop:2563 length:2022 start_codon:yes stop_codon:yes gene_type:complete
MKKYLFLITIFSIFYSVNAQNKNNLFSYIDVFDLQYVSNPQISPNGSQVIYRRMRFDILKDRIIGSLWIINTDGSDHQKLTSKEVEEYGSSWSPSGNRLAYISSTNEGSEIYVYWKNSGKIARISQLEGSPSNLSWSPDEKSIAFTMNVKTSPPVLIEMPKMPKGAKWANPARITDRLYHESDGRGYIDPGFNHVFTISSDGSGINQLTSGNFNHKGPLSWSNDNSKIFFTANRSKDWEYSFRNSEIVSVSLIDKTIQILTDRNGPDSKPLVSPNGKYIAYSGYEDKVQTYQNRSLSIMLINGSEDKVFSSKIDASINQYVWDSNSKGLYVSYDKQGDTKIAYLSLSGKVTNIANQLGGTSIGRPYGGGSFSVSENGSIAYTFTLPSHPSELAVINSNGLKKITNISDPLLKKRNLAKVETIWYKSSFDNRQIQGWVVYPPNYDSNKKYRFLVENHGGPISNYGNRFSAEIQLFASAEYIVFYPNPRGSTGYGEEFANLLYHNYPGQDYNDVMDGVDFFIKKGIAHEDELYVTGGSAGGIMTAWIIGKNNRFKAAAVIKPVMNWISKTLVADNYFQYANSRFPGQPWENFEIYWKFSPLSLVGNIETPTMVMVGMEDLRTPPSEAKQLYHALKLRKVPTVFVEIPEASHGIAKRPSNLISKVSHILAWFKKYQ